MWWPNQEGCVRELCCSFPKIVWTGKTGPAAILCQGFPWQWAHLIWMCSFLWPWLLFRCNYLRRPTGKTHAFSWIWSLYENEHQIWNASFCRTMKNQQMWTSKKETKGTRWLTPLWKMDMKCRTTTALLVKQKYCSLKESLVPSWMFPNSRHHYSSLISQGFYNPRVPYLSWNSEPHN